MDMRMVCSLASIRLKMTPREALCAATLNGAYAMGLSRDFGSITASVEFFTYAYQTPLIEKVFLRGEEYVTSRQNT